MNLLFYALGELKLSDEYIFGLASWQHHTSVTLLCLCASPCSLFSLFGQNIPPHRYPLLLICQDAKLWTNITSCNLQHKPHLVSLIRSNIVNCWIMKAFQSLTLQLYQNWTLATWWIVSQNSVPLFSLFCGQSTNTCKSACNCNLKTPVFLSNEGAQQHIIASWSWTGLATWQRHCVTAKFARDGPRYNWPASPPFWDHHCY